MKRNFFKTACYLLFLFIPALFTACINISNLNPYLSFSIPEETTMPSAAVTEGIDDYPDEIVGTYTVSYHDEADDHFKHYFTNYTITFYEDGTYTEKGLYEAKNIESGEVYYSENINETGRWTYKAKDGGKVGEGSIFSIEESMASFFAGTFYPRRFDLTDFNHLTELRTAAGTTHFEKVTTP